MFSSYSTFLPWYLQGIEAVDKNYAIKGKTQKHWLPMIAGLFVKYVTHTNRTHFISRLDEVWQDALPYAK